MVCQVALAHFADFKPGLHGIRYQSATLIGWNLTIVDTLPYSYPLLGLEFGWA